MTVLPPDFDGRSRLWFYVADRALTADETAFCQKALSEFLPEWTAHDRALKSFGAIMFDRILLIAVDETKAEASGCGIDKSARFVAALGQKIGADFFDRMAIGLLENGEKAPVFMPFQAVLEKTKRGELATGAQILDTTVLTKNDFEAGFRKPIAASWLARFL